MSFSKKHTLKGINISHLGKRKIIFKMPFWGDMLVPWRYFQNMAVVVVLVVVVVVVVVVVIVF